MAVVDSHASLYGVEGVRFVDASAFPFLPPGHPQSTICELSSGISRTKADLLDALAENIADDIKNGQ